MENRDRDKMSKNPSSPDIEHKKSDSESSFGQNIGRSEDWTEEPSRKSGSSGLQGESSRSSGSRSNLGEQSDIRGGSSSEGSE